MYKYLSRLKLNVVKYLSLDLYPDSDDIKLQTALGATVLIVGSRKRAGQQFSLVLRKSRILKREGFKKTYVDNVLCYVSDIGMVIAVVNDTARLDIVADIERDEMFEEIGKQQNWSAIQYISSKLLSNPLAVKRTVLQFI